MIDAERTGIDLTACADSELRVRSRDCEAVKLLSTQIVRKQAKAFISNDTAYCTQRRRQRFPTVRMVCRIGNGEVMAKMLRY
jgi:hypothetical protein